MTELTLLGFDYGQKKIGVAVGQTLTCTATPLTLIKVTNNKPDWAAIAHLIEEWQPNALVVGVPYCLDGSPLEMTDIAARFARQLQGRYHLPVHTVDETLSTREAQNRLRTSYNVDAVAAQVILETWFAEKQARTETDDKLTSS